MRDFVALTDCPRCKSTAHYTYTFLQYVGGMVQLRCQCEQCHATGTLWMTAQKYIFFSEEVDNAIPSKSSV